MRYKKSPSFGFQPLRVKSRLHVSKLELTGRASEHSIQRDLIAKLADLLPDGAFVCALENRPANRHQAMVHRARGVLPGMPDLLVIVKDRPAIFIEMKTRGGKLGSRQVEIHAGLRRAGALVWVCRSVRAALVALQRSGVTFRHEWAPAHDMELCEGPFGDGDHIQTAPRLKIERNDAGDGEDEDGLDGSEDGLDGYDKDDESFLFDPVAGRLIR